MTHAAQQTIKLVKIQFQKKYCISNSPLVEMCRLCNLPTSVFQCTNHLPKDGHNSTETRRKFRLNKHSRVSNFTSAANGSCVQYCSKKRASSYVAKESGWTIVKYLNGVCLRRTNPPKKKSDLSFTTCKTWLRWYESCKQSAWAPDPTGAPLRQTLQQTEHPFDVGKA